MNLRVGININWFARLRGTAFQNIVPIFVSRFPSFGRGFDSHRPFHKTAQRWFVCPCAALLLKKVGEAGKLASPHPSSMGYWSTMLPLITLPVMK
jgi:predicted amidophosphoribosyltransferase